MDNLLGRFVQLKQQINHLHKQMAQQKIITQSSTGKITVVTNGNQDVLSIKLATPAVTEAELVAIINEAIAKSRALWKEELSSLTGGLDLSAFTSLL